MTELELKSMLLRKKRVGRQLERAELSRHCRAIRKKRSALKRERHLNNIKESAEMEKAPKKAQRKHFNWSLIAKQVKPETVLTSFFQDVFSIPVDPEGATQAERLHWIEFWKNLRMDCACDLLISPKKLERVLNKLNSGKGSPDQITADVLKAFPQECLDKLARSLSMMCWDMTFPEDWMCSLTVMAPKVVGATYLTKFRLIAGLCDAKSTGLRLAHVTPSTAVRERTNCVCAGDTRGCWLVLDAASGRTVERMAGISVVVQLDVRKAFDHVEHRAAFKAMKLQGVSSRGAGISFDFHNDHGAGAARSDEELGFQET